jgi:hypothetical protein
MKEHQTDSGIIVPQEWDVDLPFTPEEVQVVVQDTDLDGEESQELPNVDDWLEALKQSNRDRVQKLAQQEAFIDPSMLILHMLHQLAEMTLSEAGLRELALRQENFISLVLDKMEEDVPQQRARETLTAGMSLNRAQRRALAKVSR